MENIKQTMLDKKVWAVAGVTDNKDRFGYKIWKILKEHGYTVYGVNPRLDELEGEKIYDSLQDIGRDIDVLDMVVGPKISMKTLEDAKNSNIDYIFFQPGSYDEEVINHTKDLGLKYLDGDCIYASLKQLEELK